MYLLVGILIIFLIVAMLVIALLFRRVVKTNEVHIVQSGGKTTSYGKDTGNGNVYYAFPSWLPVIGVSTIVLPVSVFSIKIDNLRSLRFRTFAVCSGHHRILPRVRL